MGSRTGRPEVRYCKGDWGAVVEGIRVRETVTVFGLLFYFFSVQSIYRSCGYLREELSTESSCYL